MTSHTSLGDISVLGLGSMGGALARWLLDRGHKVTVWNRSPSRSAALVDDGAQLALDPRDALAASPLSIAVVDSADTVQKWFGVADDLAGSTLVNVTTTTPTEAEGLSEALHARGGRFLDAAFFFYPDSIGQSTSAARFSGAATAWHEHRAVLDALGGDIRFLDGSPGLASVVDAAWITFYVPALTAALESVAFMMGHELSYGVSRDTLLSALPVLAGFLTGSTSLDTREFDSPNPVDLYTNSLVTAMAPIRDRGLPAALGGAAMTLLEDIPAGDRCSADISVLVQHLLDAIKPARLAEPRPST